MEGRDDGSARKRSRAEAEKASPPVRLRLEVGETARGVGHSMLLGGSAAGPPPAGPSGLLDRLKAFLPQIEAANSDLSERVKAGEDVRIDSLTDEERFIEMNVMLPGEEDDEDEAAADAAPSESGDQADGAPADAAPAAEGAAHADAKQPKQAPRPLIEEVDATPTSAGQPDPAAAEESPSAAEAGDAAERSPPASDHGADK
ncbi:hypothetical protein FNF28_05356 [Cafeteria roenbergensis]|uniref:Uncharacterized protein n=1 Tax=Cafeteria roenbergensis TaxID=33653 RepID=A0A5A8D8T7_CAFRO|nr:hypothetical protein FNF28_05356 [Cafeteria roenbergensis]